MIVSRNICLEDRVVVFVLQMMMLEVSDTYVGVGKSSRA
jgi:hypothetical protein